MRFTRWSTERVFVVGLTVVLVVLGVAQTAEAVLISYDIHDGIPWNPLFTVSYNRTAGNLMPGIEVPFGEYFYVERIWFYHGGDYPESGVPYRVYLMYRSIAQPSGDEDFMYFNQTEQLTTCNYCWEEIDVQWFVAGSSTFDDAIGIFIQPLSGSPAIPAPQLWIDSCSDHYHLACVLFVHGKSGDRPTGGRDYFDFEFYMSDYGMGEVLVGMEVENPFVTPVETRTFSAVKSLYD